MDVELIDDDRPVRDFNQFLYSVSEACRIHIVTLQNNFFLPDTRINDKPIIWK